MDALDNAGAGVVFADAGSQAGGFAVAFGDEDGVRPANVLGRFAQRAARQEMFIAERLLGIHEHDVASAAGEFPVLKPSSNSRVSQPNCSMAYRPDFTRSLSVKTTTSLRLEASM